MRKRKTTATTAVVLAAWMCGGCTSIDAYEEPDNHKSFVGALRQADNSVALAPNTIVHQVTRQGTDDDLLDRLDLLSIISLPVGLVVEAVRLAVVEDADSIFRPTKYMTYVAVEPTDVDTVIGPKDSFEVRLVNLAVDNFTEGRLRDSLGGAGADLSLQLSMHALTRKGQLVQHDREFLVTEGRKRRSPFLAALGATRDGRELLGKVQEVVPKAQDYLKNAAKVIDDLSSSLAGVTDQASARATISAALERARKLVHDDTNLDPELKAAIGVILDALGNELEEKLASTLQSPNVAALIAHATAFLADVTALLVEVLGRFGIDDFGLFEQVQVIQGLANADRLATFDFTGIRPSLMTSHDSSDPTSYGPSLDSIDTAAYLFPVDAPVNDDDRLDDRTLPGPPERTIFRGTLEDLSEVGDQGVGGFSLSVLLLERDSDEIAQAIRTVEQYARERDLKFSFSGTELQVAPIVEALAIIAEDIAEDDVELKCLDLRFVHAGPQPGATPGRDLLWLRPCKVIVTRNFENGGDFGAVAVLEIRKS